MHFLHPDFDLIALADPILESQTEAQSKFPSALIYSDALELITLHLSITSALQPEHPKGLN